MHRILFLYAVLFVSVVSGSNSSKENELRWTFSVKEDDRSHRIICMAILPEKKEVGSLYTIIVRKSENDEFYSAQIGRAVKDFVDFSDQTVHGNEKNEYDQIVDICKRKIEEKEGDRNWAYIKPTKKKG